MPRDTRRRLEAEDTLVPAVHAALVTHAPQILEELRQLPPTADAVTEWATHYHLNAPCLLTAARELWQKGWAGEPSGTVPAVLGSGARRVRTSPADLGALYSRRGRHDGERCPTAATAEARSPRRAPRPVAGGPAADRELTDSGGRRTPAPTVVLGSRTASRSSTGTSTPA